MEELYLSSDALRNLSQITRYLILKKYTIIKMSDDHALIKVFEFCKDSGDPQVQGMLNDLVKELARPVSDDATSFIFQADDYVLSQVSANVGNFVERDRRGNEKVRYYS